MLYRLLIFKKFSTVLRTNSKEKELIMTNPIQDLRNIIHTNPDSLVTHEDAGEFINRYRGSLVELHEEYFDQKNPHHYDVGFARVSVNGLSASLLGISVSCVKFQLGPSDDDLIQICQDIVSDVKSAQEWYDRLESELNYLKSILNENDLERVPFEILNVFDHLTVHPIIAEVAELPLDDEDDA